MLFPCFSVMYLPFNLCSAVLLFCKSSVTVLCISNFKTRALMEYVLLCLFKALGYTLQHCLILSA